MGIAGEVVPRWAQGQVTSGLCDSGKLPHAHKSQSFHLGDG
jgi:hypothetical protein